MPGGARRWRRRHWRPLPRLGGRRSASGRDPAAGRRAGGPVCMGIRIRGWRPGGEGSSGMGGRGAWQPATQPLPGAASQPASSMHCVLQSRCAQLNTTRRPLKVGGSRHQQAAGGHAPQPRHPGQIPRGWCCLPAGCRGAAAWPPAPRLDPPPAACQPRRRCRLPAPAGAAAALSGRPGAAGAGAWPPPRRLPPWPPRRRRSAAAAGRVGPPPPLAR